MEGGGADKRRVVDALPWAGARAAQSSSTSARESFHCAANARVLQKSLARHGLEWTAAHAGLQSEPARALERAYTHPWRTAVLLLPTLELLPTLDAESVNHSQAVCLKTRSRGRDTRRPPQERAGSGRAIDEGERARARERPPSLLVSRAPMTPHRSGASVPGLRKDIPADTVRK